MLEVSRLGHVHTMFVAGHLVATVVALDTRPVCRYSSQKQGLDILSVRRLVKTNKKEKLYSRVIQRVRPEI